MSTTPKIQEPTWETQRDEGAPKGNVLPLLARFLLSEGRKERLALQGLVNRLRPTGPVDARLAFALAWFREAVDRAIRADRSWSARE